MKVLLSSLMYHGTEFGRMIPWIRKFSGRLGVEVFPRFHEPGFEETLQTWENELKGIPVSFHEPYWEADHTYPAGTWEYRHTMEMIGRTLSHMKILNAQYLVFHHNNRLIPPAERGALLNIARKNYDETRKLCEDHGMTLAVENVGIGMGALFGEDEFIRECKRLGCPVLIDIGHGFANGWDPEHVVSSLQKQIISYHVHNNDGVNDCHWRIHNGTMDFDNFLRICKTYTPDAHLVLEYSEQTAEDEKGIEEDIRFLLENPAIL